MDYKRIADEINNDIERGVYNHFNKLKTKLELIAHKLILATSVITTKINSKDKKVLEENDYIQKSVA